MAQPEAELTDLPASPVTLYDVLGVDITASHACVRQAYYRLARLWHPDRQQSDPDATTRFQSIQAAYAVLSDKTRRQVYDLGLLEQLNGEEYLARFSGLILTVSGLGMELATGSRRTSRSHSYSAAYCHDQPRPFCLLSAAS